MLPNSSPRYVATVPPRGAAFSHVDPTCITYTHPSGVLPEEGY